MLYFLPVQDLACGADLHTENVFRPNDGRALWFYDSWVSRDRNGEMITGTERARQ